MIEEFSDPILGPALRDTLSRLTATPGVSGVLVVVFTRDFKKTTVANTIPHHLKVKVLRDLLEAMEPRRILIA
jgi:hypothetical protein